MFASILFLVGALSGSQDLKTPKIYSRWAEVIEYADNASDQGSQFFIGGMTEVEPDTFYLAGAEAFVEKRSLRTGNVVWKAALSAPSQGSWAFSDELLLGADTKGQIYGIERDTGVVRWKHVGKGLYFSRPLIHDGRVYFLNSYGVLSAHSLADGSWLWQHTETATASLHLWSEEGPQLFSNLILSGFPSGLLIAFEPMTGNRVWQESFGLAVEDSLSLNEVRSIQSEDNYLLASSYSGNLKMWKAESGSKRLLWEKRMTLHGDALIDVKSNSIFASDRVGNLHCMDLESGYIKWTQLLKSGIGTTPGLGSKLVWVSSSGGYVQAFHRESGEPIGEAFAVGSGIFGAPLVFENDEAVVFSSKGVLRRLHVFPEVKESAETTSLSSAF